MGLPAEKFDQLSSEQQLALTQFDHILKQATEKRASDIHLKVGLPPIVRVNGQLYYLRNDQSSTPARMGVNDLQAIVLSIVNDRQREKYINGEEIDLGYEIVGTGRYRLNICQQRKNPRIVARHIPENITAIEELGIPETIGQLALSQRGLILVTGSTGSGKSTTLAAIIDHITKKRSCHIVTIEDPIEFIFKDRKSIVTQREVGPDTSTFTHALKYALRQDPDVILVGEMRDEETMLMALSAAETGHLVLSTLHTMDATETINRILGSVSEGRISQVRQQLAAVLIGVVSQRLLKRKDGRGRIPAVEILVTNRRVQEIIANENRTQSLKEVMEESTALGMQTFDQSLMELYKNGLISQEEALTNCSNIRDFKLRLGGVLHGHRSDSDEMVKKANHLKSKNKTSQKGGEEILENTTKANPSSSPSAPSSEKHSSVIELDLPSKISPKK